MKIANVIDEAYQLLLSKYPCQLDLLSREESFREGFMEGQKYEKGKKKVKNNEKDIS